MLTIVPSNHQATAAEIGSAQIRADLAALESIVDAALVAAARLTQSMLTARQGSGVPIHTGQVALMRLQRAQAHLIAGSSDVFRVHDEMARIGQELGMLDDPTPASGLAAAEAPVGQAA